ncbi:MAG: glycosyltransferase family 2 protein, partial [Chlorobi bacterium]|nr:glycosyltransferase family 2 protein [Chlorobiota bacterium]
MATKLKIEGSPLVSIGVPVYNGEAFLEECLERIMGQTYENWECIVVNNCSKDNTLEIAMAFGEKDKRFRIVDNKDFLNVMQNWNETYAHVSPQAEYYKIVPADDWLFPEYLEEMVFLMENHPEVGICSSYRIDGVDVRGRGLDLYKGPVFPGKEVFELEITSKIDVTGSGNTNMFRTRFLKQLKGCPKIFSEKNLHVDMELAYDILNISDFGFVFKALSYTRRHEESISDSLSYMCNTYFCSREIILYKYKSNNELLTRYYNRLRRQYAYFIFKKRVTGAKKCIEWHD